MGTLKGEWSQPLPKNGSVNNVTGGDAQRDAAPALYYASGENSACTRGAGKELFHGNIRGNSLTKIVSGKQGNLLSIARRAVSREKRF